MLLIVPAGTADRAFLFNADRRFLTELVDDAITVERLCRAGRPCDLPVGLGLDAMPREAREVLCFALGEH